VVLEHGNAPEEFVQGVKEVEDEQARRRAALSASRTHPDITQSPLYNAVPVLAEGVRAENKPVVGAGEFQWGHALITPGHPEGTPCSVLVAQLINAVDGRTPVSGLLDRLRTGQDAVRDAQIALSAFATLQILYVDGTLKELQGI
jgi:hypothetical protein